MQTGILKYRQIKENLSYLKSAENEIVQLPRDVAVSVFEELLSIRRRDAAKARRDQIKKFMKGSKSTAPDR